MANLILIISMYCLYYTLHRLGCYVILGVKQKLHRAVFIVMMAALFFVPSSASAQEMFEYELDTEDVHYIARGEALEIPVNSDPNGLVHFKCWGNCAYELFFIRCRSPQCVVGTWTYFRTNLPTGAANGGLNFSSRTYLSKYDARNENQWAWSSSVLYVQVTAFLDMEVVKYPFGAIVAAVMGLQFVKAVRHGIGNAVQESGYADGKKKKGDDDDEEDNNTANGDDLSHYDGAQ